MSTLVDGSGASADRVKRQASKESPVEAKRTSESLDVTASPSKRCKGNPVSIESNAVQKDSPPSTIQTHMDVVPETPLSVLSQSEKADLAGKAAEKRAE